MMETEPRLVSPPTNSICKLITWERRPILKSFLFTFCPLCVFCIRCLSTGLGWRNKDAVIKKLLWNLTKKENQRLMQCWKGASGSFKSFSYSSEVPVNSHICGEFPTKPLFIMKTWPNSELKELTLPQVGSTPAESLLVVDCFYPRYVECKVPPVAAGGAESYQSAV